MAITQNTQVKLFRSYFPLTEQLPQRRKWISTIPLVIPVTSLFCTEILAACLQKGNRCLRACTSSKASHSSFQTMEFLHHICIPNEKSTDQKYRANSIFMVWLIFNFTLTVFSMQFFSALFNAIKMLLMDCKKYFKIHGLNLTKHDRVLGI